MAVDCNIEVKGGVIVGSSSNTNRRFIVINTMGLVPLSGGIRLSLGVFNVEHFAAGIEHTDSN
jgi:hypothetical protein